MKIIDRIFDKKIKALNVLVDMSVEKYFEISQEIIKKNEFQRRRVKSSSTVYSLLKSDLLEGCVIPPIVLALSRFESDSIEDEENQSILDQINEKKDRLLILDGLQRTYTIRDLILDLKSEGDDDKLETLLNYRIRVEVYIGIDKLGILYRMLTLNTGQTPMSIRHQIEILYSDYLIDDLGEIKFITESDDTRPKNFGEYKFKDVVEGFNSYLERDYLTIDRFDILDNIKSLEKLSKEKTNTNLFESFIQTYHNFSKLIIEKSQEWEFKETEGTKLSGQPFGRTADRIFSKSQVMTGFGSAIGKLIDFELLDAINDINDLSSDIPMGTLKEDLNELIKKLDSVRTLAKKIGNDQRMFFHFFFRELFDKKGDAYLNIGASIEEAYKSYERKTQ
jgi:hypothetical protein